MNEKSALIVDDEPDIRELLEITLGRMNINTVSAPDIGTARAHLAEHSFDLCLTDMQLPDGNGIELVTHIAREIPQLPVAVITAFGNMDTAITALKAGAFDFVQKPVDLEQLRALVETAIRIGDCSSQKQHAGNRLTGKSEVMQRLRLQIAKLARSQAPIYISGESGSGKELAARSIHEQGPRAAGPFVPVNCGAIPSELMESEFFGHVKGSFTGAVADKQGLFQAAAGGTLFLDEVADLPLSMQVKLLRAIQEKAVRAVGAASEETTEVRILSATHKDLARAVEDGLFRKDLYFRLNVIELPMPSLRERPEDIPDLAIGILQRLAADYGGEAPAISEAAMRALQSYSFPGNVRELENVLERAFTLCEKGQITPTDLQLETAAQGPAHRSPVTESPAGLEHDPAQDPGQHADPPGSPSVPNASQALTLPPGESLESFLDSIERRLITDALEATRWNKTAAAKSLGITFRALRYRLKKLDLE
jgi:two-component system response regulator PilR (NtrC family)